MKKIMLVAGIILLLVGGYRVYASETTPEVVENENHEQMEINDSYDSDHTDLKRSEDSSWMSDHHKHHRRGNHQRMSKKGIHRNGMMNHHDGFNCHR